MKKFSSVLFFALLILFPAGWGRAAEKIALESLPTGGNADLLDNPFSLTVRQNGTLVTKPGPVLTEKGDYAGMQLPYLTSTPKPIAYPRLAVQRGWEGELVIAVEILTDGAVGRHQVMESTGHGLLDKIAAEAVRSWKFHPAMKNGEPVLTCIAIPIRFELQGE